MNVVLLTLFRATAKKDDNLFAIFSKVNAIPGTEVDSGLKNTGSDTLDVGQVPKPHAVESRRHLCPGLRI
jgi:hypothetical protein